MDLAFTFAAPGRLLFGPGRAEELGAIVAGFGARPFVCTGSRPDRHAALLAGLGASVATFPVAGEPTLDLLRAATAAARAHGADVVVGLGGGSVVDTAKMVAALVTQSGDALDFVEVIGAGKPLDLPLLPCIAVPTTAGTGSEMTANGVVASPEHGVKVSLRSTAMLPRVAVVDPLLTLDCPPAVTAASGLDAVTQCLEAFVTPAATPLTDGFAREGLRRAGSGLRSAYRDGSGLTARTDMALCATLSGLALANAKLGAVHGIAGPLGGMIDAPHGALCAALLVATCEVNAAALERQDAGHAELRRYDEAGELLTGSRGRGALTGWLRETAREFQVVGLGALGLARERIPEVIAKAQAASSMKGNPVRLGDDEVAEILLRSWESA